MPLLPYQAKILQLTGIGAPVTNTIMQTDGGAPATKAANTFVTATDVITTGAWTTNTIAAQPDVPRNVRVTMTDVNASVGSLVVEVFGTNQFGDAAKERIVVHTGGSAVVGKIAFKTLTKIRHKATGTGAAGVDTFTVGDGDALGVPQIFLASDWLQMRLVAGNTADAGTMSYKFMTWTPENGNIPNSARTYQITTQAPINFANSDGLSILKVPAAGFVGRTTVTRQ